MPSAMRKRGNLLSPSLKGENIAPSSRKLTEDVAIQGFSATILHLPLGEIARAAQSTKEAAKGWRQGKAMPRAVPLLNMAMTIPGVWEWIVATRGGHPESPQSLDALLRQALKQVKNSQ